MSVFRREQYTPNEITLNKGVRVVLEITSIGRAHGFKVPELGIRAERVGDRRMAAVSRERRRAR